MLRAVTVNGFDAVKSNLADSARATVSTLEPIDVEGRLASIFEVE